jgi:ParB/RepB/Spo0J family partition protein
MSTKTASKKETVKSTVKTVKTSVPAHTRADAELKVTKSDVFNVPMSMLHVEKGFNARQEFDEADIKELAEDMKLNGQLQPITVTKVQGKDEYLITNGERRYRAGLLIAKGNPHFTLKALKGPADKVDRLVYQYISNTGRAFTDYENATLVSKLLAEGLDIKEVATRLRLSPQNVYNYTTLLKAPEQARELVRDNKVSATFLIDQVRTHTTEVINDKKVEKVVDEAAIMESLQGAMQNAEEEAKRRGLDAKVATQRHAKKSSEKAPKEPKEPTRSVQSIVFAWVQKIGERQTRTSSEDFALELLTLIGNKAEDKEIAKFLKSFE